MMFHDYYLKAVDEAAMDEALLTAGFLVANEEPQEEGDPVVTLSPAEGVSLDRIGEIVRYDENGDPIVYPEYHANIRLTFAPSEEQLAAIEPILIVPPAMPYRIWAGGND